MNGILLILIVHGMALSDSSAFSGSWQRQNSTVVKNLKHCFSDHCDKRHDNAALVQPSLMMDDYFENSPCFCDDACKIFGDCCIDKLDSLISNVQLFNQWDCVLLPSTRKKIYAISSCPDNWPNRKMASRCRREVLSTEMYSYLLDVPVVSLDSKRFYANLYCAQCHADINLLPLNLFIHTREIIINKSLEDVTYVKGELQWLPSDLQSSKLNLGVSEYVNWLDLSKKYSLRRCKSVIKKCPKSYKSIEIANKCEAYASYVTAEENSQSGYKNKYCIQCNENKVKDNFPCHTDRRVNDKDSPSAPLPGPFSVLLDFNPGSGIVGHKRCLKNEIVDHVENRCISFGCGELYDKIDENCTLIESIASSSNSSFVNMGCPIFLINKADTVFRYNESLYINSSQKTYKAGDFSSFNDTHYRVCADNPYVLKFPAIQSRLSVVTMSISLCCLAAHIMIYLAVPKLHNLPGKTLLSLSLALFVGQITFFLGINKTHIQQLCIAIAITIHYSFLAAFFWMNIIAIDIYRTFAKMHIHSQSTGRNKLFCRYCIYAWLMPLIIVLAALIVEFGDVYSTVRPNYGSYYMCWITDRKGLLVFFVTPLAIVLIVNVIFFVLSAYSIHKTSEMVQCAKRSTECVRFYLYVKLAFIMGLTWIVGFIAAVAELEVLWYGFIFLNALQGAFIFVMFTLKRKVLQHLYQCVTGKPLPSIGRNTTSSNLRLSSDRSSGLRGCNCSSERTKTTV